MWVIFTSLIILGSFYLTGGFKIPTHPESAKKERVIMGQVAPDAEKKNIQIETIPFTTIAPTPPRPPRKCALEGVKEDCECDHIPDIPEVPEITCSKTNNCELWQVCEDAGWPPDDPPIKRTTLGGHDLTKYGVGYALRCQWLRNTLSDGKEYCLAKPVVYLYPEKPTYVDVKVETPGTIFISIPLYPEGGWKNVLAHPDGTLKYQGKKYSELFYESTVKDVKKPKNGIIFKAENLEKDLSTTLKKIGLNDNETNDFLEYWVPTLKKLSSKYILFSLIDKEEKERIDRLVVNPEPDTRIEFIAYFKPLDKIIEIPPLILPGSPPKRIGFTEVEWGGTIDNFSD